MAKWSETGETKSGPKSAGVYVFMMIYAMRWSDINIINIFRCIPMVKDRADYECGVNNMRQWFSLPFIRSVTIGKHMLVFACARSSLALAGPDSWWLASAYLFGTLRISQKSNASKSTQTRSLFFPIFWFWTILTRVHMLFDCPLGYIESTCLDMPSLVFQRCQKGQPTCWKWTQWTKPALFFFPDVFVFSFSNADLHSPKHCKMKCAPKNKAYAAYVDIRVGHVLIYKVAHLELDLFALSTFSNLHQQKESLSFLFANLLAGFRKANSA